MLWLRHYERVSVQSRRFRSSRVPGFGLVDYVVKQSFNRDDDGGDDDDEHG